MMPRGSPLDRAIEPTSSAHSLSTRTRVAVLGIVLAVCLLDTVHVYLGARGGGRDVSLISVVYRVTLFWLIYAALLHYVFKFSMAYPLNLSTWKSPLIHVVAAIGSATYICSSIQ
jgi:hypothetical protein